ncbi:hypothetical protein AX16_011036 [Volvariella volvacea WC 439]|nr:hypothetical protein AX16_011036 [Volvariella volvacea WC 439]
MVSVVSLLLFGIRYNPVSAISQTGRSWASLQVGVPENLTDLDRDPYVYANAKVILGTPPQAIDLAIHFEESLFTIWSSNCAFCPYGFPFFPSRSSTLQSENQPWELNSPTAHGTWYNDTIGFGELRAVDVQFVLMQELSVNYPGQRPFNGQLGIWTNSSTRKSVFNQLWDQGLLLNPVVGLRLDPTRSRMTVGALDPDDYIGSINWIEVRGAPADHIPPGAGAEGRAGWRDDGFVIDGIKGYSGSFIPFETEEITATLSTFFRNILVPPDVYSQYFSNPDHHGPNLSPTIFDGNPAFNCSGGEDIVVPFTITINGIDYPLVEQNNWIRPYTSLDICRVGLANYTTVINGEGSGRVRPVGDVELGLPFMRSVYVAYRFPTSDSPDCPAHIGFAFPSGIDRTEEQINQTPRSLPPLHDQCLSLISPTEGPVSNPPESQFERGSGAYTVFGDTSGERQVRLVGANELGKRK